MFNRTALVGLWHTVGCSTAPTIISWHHKNKAYYIVANPNKGYYHKIPRRLYESGIKSKKMIPIATAAAQKMADYYVRQPRNYIRSKSGYPIPASAQRIANWKRWIEKLPHIQKMICRYFGHKNIPIVVFDGIIPPTVIGKPASKRSGKRYKYSTITLMVGVRWLQNHYNELLKHRK